MCEVTLKNFKDVLPKLEDALKCARFITIDLEFSCLTASQKFQTSLFDTAPQRYVKLKKTVERMVPVQIGLTAFEFNRDNNTYTGHIYTFYLFPRIFSFIDRIFFCQASSFQFLSTNNFEFNKFVNDGVSYINRNDENQLRKMLLIEEGDQLDTCMPEKCTSTLALCGELVRKWICTAKDEEILVLDNVQNIYNNYDLKYFLHKRLREIFDLVWTFEDNEGFKVQKKSAQQRKQLCQQFDLEESLINDLLGFTHIFRLLVSMQKPIIGHNLLLDLMIMIHHFENPLPKSYGEFKNVVHSLFPTIYDTKCISFDILDMLKDKKQFPKNTLENLYQFFKNNNDRYVSMNSPIIESTYDCVQQFHYSGWDSFCTGYIFISMAHIYASKKNNVKRKKFMSNELLSTLNKFKNSVNMIRADVSHIQLDATDPVSTRPPRLIVEAKKNKPLNIEEVTTLLCSCGFVEVKRLSYKGHRAIIAVDNFSSARRILKEFKGHSDFSIQKYNALKHSPVVETVLWSGIMAAGITVAWIVYSKIK